MRLNIRANYFQIETMKELGLSKDQIVYIMKKTYWCAKRVDMFIDKYRKCHDIEKSLTYAMKYPLNGECLMKVYDDKGNYLFTGSTNEVCERLGWSKYLFERRRHREKYFNFRFKKVNHR